MPVTFTLEKTCPQTGARAGVLHTPHGDILTPVYMPVGTQATVKAIAPHTLLEMDAGIILANTYHLAMRPGSELIHQAGGLHTFMRWPRAILTDSGGFQVFSLAQSRRITQDGVEFQSHIDGSRHFFSPEYAIQLQNQLGADIIMAFDECAPYPADKGYTYEAMQRTHDWATRCQAVHHRPNQALFGIVQGGMYADLRRQSAIELANMDFPGYGIGGLSVGEPKNMMYEMLDSVLTILPADKPRYLMGVGSPDCLIRSVGQGVDMFDCVMQTRMGRTAAALTGNGRMNLRNECYKRDFDPIDLACGCPACSGGFSRAYIRHLFMAKEILGPMLLSVHNIWFSINLMRRVRQAILQDQYPVFAREQLAVLQRESLPDQGWECPSSP